MTEKHIFIGKHRQFSLTFHPGGTIECDIDNPCSKEEMHQVFDWIGFTISIVRDAHDPNLSL